MSDFYNLKILNCGGEVEIYRYSRAVFYNTTAKKGDKGEKKELTEAEKKYNKERGREATLNNARNSIKRVIKTNRSVFKSFITLTFNREIEYTVAKKELKKFFERMKKSNKEFKYIWVLELQSRSLRPHFHLLTNYEISFETAKKGKRKTEEQKELELIFSMKYWKNGFCDLRKIDNVRNISLYLTIYLTEDLFLMQSEELKGQRVYSYSRNLEKPVISRLYSSNTLEQDFKYFNNCGLELNYCNSYHTGINENVTYFEMKEK